MTLQLNAQPGGSSFSNLFTPSTTPGPGQQTVTSTQDANSQVTPTIDAAVQSQPYNFILGTTGGSTNPTAIMDGSNAVLPVDNGDPEFDVTGAQVFAALGTDGTTDPADLDPNTFDAWTAQQQLVYLMYWGNRQFLFIGTNVDGGANAVSASVSNNTVSTQSLLRWWIASFGATPTINQANASADTATWENALSTTDASVLQTAPADLDPSVYLSWSATAQNAYVDYWNGNGAGSPFLIGSGPDALVAPDAAIAPITKMAIAVANTLDPATPLGTLGTTPLDLGSAGALDPADLDPATFEQWTSEQQAEYMRFHNLQTADIGSSVSGATPITVVLSQDATRPNTVFIVENLQASDLATMSTADLTAVEATGALNAGLGFTAQTSDVLTGLQSDVATIEGDSLTTSVTLGNFSAVTNSPVGSDVSGPPPVGNSYSVDSSGVMTFTSVTEDALGDYSQVQAVVTPGANGAGTAQISTSTFLSPTNSGYNAWIESTATQTADATISAPTSSTPGETTQPTGSNAFSASDGSFGTVTAGASGGQTTSFAATVTVETVALQDANGSTIAGPVDGGFSAMPNADRQVFIDELNLLQTQVNKGSLATTQAANTAADIMQRYYQAALYWGEITQSTTPSNGLTQGVISQDGDTSLKAAYQTFVAQEKAILQAGLNQENLASPASQNSPAIDAPTAATVGLTSMMSAQQAEVEIGTTQLQQIQSYLQAVAAMQALVNNAASAAGAAGGAVGLSGLTANTQASTLSPADLAVFEMFVNASNRVSPILAQYGINVQSYNLSSQLLNTDGTFNGNTQDGWSKIGTDLSNIVTQVQQQSQTLTTELNQDTQQENNIFTEMTSVIGQVSTIINDIGTNMAS